MASGQADGLEFILEKANAVSSSGICTIQTPRHPSPLLDPLSFVHPSIHPSTVMQTGHRRSVGRGACPFPLARYSEYPQAFQRCEASRITKFPFRSSASFIRPEFCFYLPRKRSQRKGREREDRRAKDIRVDFTAASGQRRYFTPVKRGNWQRESSTDGSIPRGARD